MVCVLPSPHLSFSGLPSHQPFYSSPLPPLPIVLLWFAICFPLLLPRASSMLRPSSCVNQRDGHESPKRNLELSWSQVFLHPLALNGNTLSAKYSILWRLTARCLWNQNNGHYISNSISQPLLQFLLFFALRRRSCCED